MLAKPAGVVLLVLLPCVVWATWGMLREMSRRWEVDPTYSHGYLVPLIGLVILWSRRDRMPAAAARPVAWGLVLVALGVLCQLAGAALYIRWMAGFSLLVYLAAAALMAGGWAGLKWAAPAIGFLVFMIPLPYRIEASMRQPLQRVSTRASALALQTLGQPAVTEGNVILINNKDNEPIELGVVDACSGLKMFIVFIGLCTAVALLVQRPLGDRLLILLSAGPIAILCNVIRITATGLLHVVAGERLANLVFHDLAGWLMMPMALFFLWLELKLLSLLLVDERPAEGSSFRLDQALAAAGAGKTPSVPR